MDKALEILRIRFGFDAFRAGQGELVDAILSGRDVVGVMPTGAGKSICYQVPALALPGLTLVVSPLVSLMNDQVSALVNAGIPAAFLNSQLGPREREEVMWRAEQGEFKLLYVAPERLGDPDFAAFATAASIPLVAVDEAHCVSQWGQDFRPSYLRIAEFIATLRQRPTVAAFTATATPRVAADIARLLDLRDPLAVTTGFDRPNLRFEVEQLSDRRKLARVLEVTRQHAGESGIIYCSTRKQVEAVHEHLVKEGVPATRYHAGLGNAERDRNQRAFVNDDAPVIVATNAFGMGIDKSNVRYVLHHNMPGSLEAYYQEAGRAGRDGEPSLCLLLWNDSDIATARFFIEQDSGNEALTPEEADAVRASQRRRLAAMTGYCTTVDCLRVTILRYFGSATGPDNGAGLDNGAVARCPKAREAGGLGQRATAPLSSPAPLSGQTGCNNCSNCSDDARADAIEVTNTARAVMRCVQEFRGRFGKGIIADVLTGSKSAKICEWNLDRAKTYNIVDESAATVKEIIELLASGGYLEITEGRFPLVGLGPRAREAAATNPDFHLYMKRKPKPGRATQSKGQPAAAQLETPEQQELFERLRTLRKRLADEEGVPPYIVFSDAALRAMCAARPATDDEFLAVNGVGPVKLERYGAAFLAELQS